MLDSTSTILGSLVSVGVIAGFAAAGFKWVRPAWRRHRAQKQLERAILYGQDEIRNPITGDVVVKRTPNVAVGLAELTETVVGVKEEISGLTALLNKYIDLKTQVDDHGRRIKNLEGNALERAVSRYEAAETWKAVGKIADGDDHPLDES